MPYSHFPPTKVIGGGGLGYRQKIIMKCLQYYGELRFTHIRRLAWFHDTKDDTFQCWDTVKALVARGLLELMEPRGKYKLTVEGIDVAKEISEKYLYDKYRWYLYGEIPTPEHDMPGMLDMIMHPQFKDALGDVVNGA